MRSCTRRLKCFVLNSLCSKTKKHLRRLIWDLVRAFEWVEIVAFTRKKFEYGRNILRNQNSYAKESKNAPSENILTHCKMMECGNQVSVTFWRLSWSSKVKYWVTFFLLLWLNYFVTFDSAGLWFWRQNSNICTRDGTWYVLYKKRIGNINFSQLY